MKPWVLAACLAALLIAMGQLAPPIRPRVIAVAASTTATTDEADPQPNAAAPCPRGSLPDDGVCVPVPAAQLSSPAPSSLPMGSALPAQGDGRH